MYFSARKKSYKNQKENIVDSNLNSNNKNRSSQNKSNHSIKKQENISGQIQKHSINISKTNLNGILKEEIKNKKENDQPFKSQNQEQENSKKEEEKNKQEKNYVLPLQKNDKNNSYAYLKLSIEEFMREIAEKHISKAEYGPGVCPRVSNSIANELKDEMQNILNAKKFVFNVFVLVEHQKNSSWGFADFFQGNSNHDGVCNREWENNNFRCFMSIFFAKQYSIISPMIQKK